ncbi:thioredoxin family protein [Polaribacter cellanae]|uniref:Thioredoxin family protein n=1 Tax=Polaribacter cellanae TaxID=2818493 RepID=A0A975CV27_9FLAO|nr:thioredoxin family protein [Polaribacter cellanae]QTE24086.1 thioredoxin family protein [Polaribacter cellanae]
MKYLFLFLFTITLTSCSAQQEITAAKNKSGDLVGFANKTSFMQAPYNAWFTQNYKNYKPDAKTIEALKKELKGYKIKGFMGTWCGDSKRETPHLFKILEAANFNMNKLELVTVNRSKKTPDNLQESFNILRVPTFIFYKNDKEVGRYVEYARESLEKDILKILSKQPYKHSYDKSK